MKRLIFLLSLITSFLVGFGQGDVVGGRVIARQAFFLRDRWIDTIKVDTNYLEGNNASLMTAGAIYDWVTGRIANIEGGSGGVSNNIYTADGVLVGDRTLTGDNHLLLLEGLLGFGVGISGASGYSIALDVDETNIYSPDRVSLISLVNNTINVNAVNVVFPELAGEGDAFLKVDENGRAFRGTAGTPGSGISEVVAGFGLINENDSTLAINVDDTDLQDWIIGLINPNLIVQNDGVGVAPWRASGDTLYISLLSGINGLAFTKLTNNTIQGAIDTAGTIASKVWVAAQLAELDPGGGNIQEVEDLDDADFNQAIFNGGLWVKIGAWWYTFEKSDSLPGETTQLSSPGPLNLTVIDDDEIDLGWTNVANETNYEIQRGLASDYSDATTINSPAANTTTYNNTGLSPSTHYYYRIRAVGDGVSYSNSIWVNADATTDTDLDPDADAYFIAVAAAGGTISDPDKAATNTAILALKSNSLWTKINYLWPIMGGTANSHAVPLRGGVSLTYAGGLTHSATGIDPNGTSGYANLNISPLANFTVDDWHMGIYIREDVNSTTVDLGCRRTTGTAATVRIASRLSGNIQYMGSDATASTVATANSLGLYILDRGSSGSRTIYKNGSSASSASVASITFPTFNLYAGAENSQGTAGNFSSREFCLLLAGVHLTAGEQATLNTIIETWQDALGRGVQ